MSFAERLYQVESGGTIRIRFFEPVEEEDGTWRGPFELEWPAGDIRQISGPGVDKLDAFLTAVALARINLEAFEVREGRKINWEMGSDHFLHAFGTCSDLRPAAGPSPGNVRNPPYP